MLFAIEWIRAQITAIFNFVYGLLEALTLESIGSFLVRSPVFLVLYILAGLVLTLAGFRVHKLFSGLVGGTVMGCFGWQAGAAINPHFISCRILWMLFFAIIGLFLFYFLFVINVSIGAFLVYFAGVCQLFAVGMKEGAISGAAFVLIFCILLVGRHCIRTSIAGGTLLGLITLHYFGYIAALGVFTACIAGGTALQSFLRKRYDEATRKAEEYKPNAPAPPTPEEIAAEIAEEEAAKKAERQDGGVYAGSGPAL